MRLRNTAAAVLALSLLAGSATVAVAQGNDTSAEPSFFTWTVDMNDFEFGDGSFSEDVPGFVKLYGETLGETVVADDPRASGRLSTVKNTDNVFTELGTNDEQILGLEATHVTLANDGGSWVGTGIGAIHMWQFSDDVASTAAISTLTGTGGYDGLTLVLANTTGGSWGWIVPSTSVPPVPEPMTE